MSMTDAQILEAALDGTLIEDDGHIEGAADDGANTAQPTTGPEPEVKPAPEQGGTADTEVEGVPILSKSGGYTIPYQKLADARAERDALREQVAQLQQQVAGLSQSQQQNLAEAQSNAQDRADAGQGQTQADANLAAATQAMAQGVDVSVFGDFSEEAIAKGVAELNRRAIEQIRAEVQESIRRELAPVREKEAMSAQSAHEAAILAAHPDAYEIAESTEFSAWRDGLPAFARAGVDHALDKGTPKAVIEVFDAFRATRPQQAATTTSTKAAPEALKPRVPNSLSEVPGAAPLDEMQQTLAAAGNSASLLDRMGSMTADQLDALMDKI